MQSHDEGLKRGSYGFVSRIRQMRIIEHEVVMMKTRIIKKTKTANDPNTHPFPLEVHTSPPSKMQPFDIINRQSALSNNRMYMQHDATDNASQAKQ
jgi:hypothetical protein